MHVGSVVDVFMGDPLFTEYSFDLFGELSVCLIIHRRIIMEYIIGRKNIRERKCKEESFFNKEQRIW